MEYPEYVGHKTAYKKLCILSLISALLAMIIFTFALCANKNPKENIPADSTPPVISGAKDLSIYLGESPAYRKGITISDDSGEDIILEIDSSAVILDQCGRYPVIYSATDKSGNTSSVTVFLNIEIYFPKQEELNIALDMVISEIITPAMNTEQKIRAVYSYVQSHIAFENKSDKSNWKAEAYKGLFVTNSGDCFTFFASSKAFFERLGIENLDIKRPDDVSEKMNQTHYWSMVNISDDPSQRIWYHYDSTRLRQQYNHSGCLLTQKQIDAYDFVRKDFYNYDRNAYPEVCGTIITPTPELEGFYNKS